METPSLDALRSWRNDDGTECTVITGRPACDAAARGSRRGPGAQAGAGLTGSSVADHRQSALDI